MKTTKKIIQENNGENRGTYSSIGFAENFTGDINEVVQRFVSWDCNILTDAPRYRIIEVDIPIWMTENDYLLHNINLKYAHALAGDIVYEFTKEEFVRFVNLPSKCKFWFGWATTKKNDFLKSLVSQFKAWLVGEVEHGTPLSYRQFEAGAKYCPLYEVNRIESQVYRNSKY